MKKLSWLVCCTVLAVCLLLMFPAEAHAAEIVDSGTCGENLTWTLDGAGTLSISGTGAMLDYWYGEAPWYSSRDAVVTAIIDNRVTRIGNFAFEDCRSLTSITIPDSVTSIGDSAFSGCFNLTSVRISNSVTFLGDGAFAHCSSLARIEIPGSVASLYSTFYGCDNLASVSLNEGLTHIWDGTFYGCYLTEIRIPDSVTYISDNAFDSCSALTSVTIGKGVTHIERNAFGNCESLEHFYVDEANTSFSSDSFGALYNKDKTKLIQFPSAYKGSFEVPDGVTEIGHAAFAYCSRLSSVSIPSSVTNIDLNAFCYTEGFDIWGGPFAVHPADGAAAISEILVSEDNAAYSSENGVLYNKSESVLLQIPSQYAGHLTLPESVSIIGEYAVAFCSELTGITIPDTVTEIEKYAFYKCGLETIALPNQLTNIKEGTFGRSSITECFIPDSVVTIGRSAFQECSNLKNVTISDGVTSIEGGAFWCCANLKTVTIGTGLTSIGEYAFAQCSSLISITIPHGMTSIENAVFSRCTSLTSITIPESVTTVVWAAFNDCDSLASVYYYGDETQWNTISIDPDRNDALLNAKIYYNADEPIPGDLDGDFEITSDDVVQLLLHVSMPDVFPITAGADFTGDGKVTSDDVVQLLLHVSMPDIFPLQVVKKEDLMV